MNEFYWAMANEIVDLDPEQSHKASLRSAIENQDKVFSNGLVNSYDYLGFDGDMELIGVNKEYMAKLPEDAFSNAFDEWFSIVVE